MNTAGVILVSMATSIVTAASTVAAIDYLGLTKPVEQPKVPKVVGLSESDAKTNLEAAGYSLMVKAREAKPGVEPGTAIEQAPAEGQPLDKGQPVSVTFALALPKIPDVVGKSVADATKALEEAGYKVSVGDAKPSADHEEGQVIKQAPEPGVELQKDSTVTIEPSAGPELVEVPKLNGMGVGVAKLTVEKVGLKLKISWTDLAETASNVVLRQTPKAGESVAPGSEVTVTANRPGW